MVNLKAQIAELFLEAQAPVFDAVRTVWSWSSLDNRVKRGRQVKQLRDAGLCIECRGPKDRDGIRCVRCNQLKNQHSRTRYRKRVSK